MLVNGLLKRCFSGLPALLTAAGMLAACAPAPIVETPPVPVLRNQPHYDIESVDPLEISTEMKQFVAEQLARRRQENDRAWQLAYAMLDPYIFDFTYDPAVTLTAAEAFRARRGNCLTFSNLFIAMAREADLSAWYRQVEIEPEWSSRDENLLVSLHVNAATADRMKEYVVDVSRRRENKGEFSRRLSDREAEAQFYNNLGANALVMQDLALAYAYFRKAERTHPGLAYVWSNLGVTLNRNGQPEDAILAYETALMLEPDHTVSLNNLYTIYEDLGDTERALAIQEQVERNRRRNPYYLHYLAEVAFAGDDFDDAVHYAKRAIRLEDREYRFWYTLAQLQFRTGETDTAESNLQRAVSLAPEWVETAQLVLPGEVPELPVEH
jgi:tetratricopeptide (TPR) repeat protein